MTDPLSKYDRLLRLARKQRKSAIDVEARRTLIAAMFEAANDAEATKKLRVELLEEQLRLLGGLRWHRKGEAYDPTLARTLERELSAELGQKFRASGARRSVLWWLLGDSAGGDDRYQDACQYYTRALRLAERSWGMACPRSVDIRWSLVECLVALGDVATALVLAETNYRVVQVAARTEPRLHPDFTMQTTLSFAKVLLKAHAYERARPLLQEACSLLREAGSLTLLPEFEQHLADVEARLNRP